MKQGPPTVTEVFFIRTKCFCLLCFGQILPNRKKHALGVSSVRVHVRIIASKLVNSHFAFAEIT